MRPETLWRITIVVVVFFCIPERSATMKFPVFKKTALRQSQTKSKSAWSTFWHIENLVALGYVKKSNRKEERVSELRDRSKW